MNVLLPGLGALWPREVHERSAFHRLLDWLELLLNLFTQRIVGVEQVAKTANLRDRINLFSTRRRDKLSILMYGE